MHKPDALLETDVEEAFSWDRSLIDRRIVVKAHDGRVTLRGAVETYPELIRAEDDAWTVHGVTAVDNELLVGTVGEAVLDKDIEDACLAALDADKSVPKGAVGVAVTGGWVTMSGKVRNHLQRIAAKRAVAHVDGVLGVVDNVAIGDQPLPDDVAGRINKAFQRSAIIDDSLIEVSSSGSTVYLDGTCDSGYAMREAVETAWKAPGVTGVVNRLVVVPAARQVTLVGSVEERDEPVAADSGEANQQKSDQPKQHTPSQ
jgi:osmotically-inducible protein OsmY